MKTAAFVLLLSSAAAAQVTVTGTVRYEDRSYDGSGFTGSTPFRPVRQAEVELLDGGTSLGLGTTDNNGDFSFPGIASGLNVHVLVYARRVGGPFNAAVRNNLGTNALYAATTTTIDTATTSTFGTIDLLLGGAGPVFNIFDCAVKSFEYLAFLDPGLAVIPPMIVYWEPGTNNGTYFDAPVNGIFLLGRTSDPDEYDDDIILHEMGHWIATTFSKDDTLGGPHSVIDQLDPRTSWSEGWAHYWSASVRRRFPLEYLAPTKQVDNFGASFSVFDIEAPTYPAFAVMATNELAVSAALWDITDPGAAEVFDGLSGFEPELWRAVRLQIPSRTNITLEDFHAGFEAELPAPQAAAIMAAVTGSEGTVGIFKDRGIRYYADGSEPNDSAGAATPLPLGPAGLTRRTFFGAPDEDWYSVDATPGTLVVETLNLGDGANTALEIYDATGTTLRASNDNRSVFDLSSRAEVFAPSPLSFRIRVFRSGSVVDYGSYDIRAESVRARPPTSHEFQHNCGALGLEALAAVLLIRLLRRRPC